MAGNNRDVKLTIRAKDEASAVMAKVTEALNKYGKGSDDLSKKISPIGDKFKRLTAEVSTLQSTLAKGKGQIAIAGQYKILSDTLSKVSADHAKATAAITENNEKLIESKTRLDSVTAARDASRKALAEDKNALREATREVDRNTKGLAGAREASAKYGAELAKREAQMAGYRTDLSRATQAQEAARQSDEKAARTATVLRERLADLRTEREAQRRTLTTGGMTARTDRTARIATQTQDPWAGLAARSFADDEGSARSRLVSYDAEIARVRALADAADATRARTQSSLKATSATVQAVQADMVKMDNTASLGRKLAASNSDIVKFTNELDKSSSAVTRLKAATDAGSADVQQYSAAVQTGTNDVQRLESESRKLANTLASSASSMETVSNAMSEMSSEANANGFGKLESDIAALEKALARVEQRLKETAEMSARLAKYSDGAGGFTNAADAGKLRQLNSQLSQSTEDAKQFRQEVLRLQTGLSGVGRNSQTTKNEIKNLSAAIKAAEGDARKYKNEIRAIGIQSGQLKGTMVDAWNAHNASSRTALSLQQRIRGQVLSMIAAYGGLYGVAGMIRSVSEAYMQQEAAISRLGVVFSGNSERIGVEIGWIRREAQRLGIEFGTLADEYTKFAVAGKTSGFTEDSIRTIFTSVSEAARVNKLGLEDIQGVYLALSQMISKGKISAEELRQQLGERLPGAMSLMAKAMGVTVAELDDMMKKGQALSNEDNMLKFAGVLTETFGSQLPASLRTFTTEWGRLQNTIYNSKLLIGQGGLIEGLTDAMRRINEYASSREGTKFFLALGNAMGDAAQWIPYILENFEKFVSVLKALMIIPIIGFFNKAGASLKLFGGALMVAMGRIAGAPAALLGFRTAMVATTTTTGFLTTAIKGLGTALMTLGPIAAGIFAASYVFSSISSWEDGVNSITEAQAQHARIMDTILAKYDEARGKTYSWKDAISEKNKEELATQLTPNREAFEAAQGKVADIGSQREWTTGNIAKDFWTSIMGDTSSIGDDIILSGDIAAKFGIDEGLGDRLRKQFGDIMQDINKATKAQLIEFQGTVNQFAAAVPDEAVKNRFMDISKYIDTMIQTGNNTSLTITTMRELGHTIEDTNNVVDRFPITMEEAANGAKGLDDELSKTDVTIRDKFIKPLQDAINKGGDFKEGVEGLDLYGVIKGPFDEGHTSVMELLSAMGNLKAFMPQLQAAFKQFAADGSLSSLEQRLSWMKNIPELNVLLQKFVGGVIGDSLGSKGQTTQDFEKTVGTDRGRDLERLVIASSKLAAEMGISAKDLITTFGYETGGTYDKWQAGPTTQWGQHRGLIQWGEPQAAEFGVSAQSSIEDQIAAVGKYLKARGVKPGMGLLEIYAAINAGDATKFSASDENNGGAPGTVRDKVNSSNMANHSANAAAMLELYGYGADAGKFQGEAAKKAADEAEKAVKAKKEENAAISEGLLIEQMRVDGKEREAFIQEKINAYTSKHGQLSKEELDTLTQQYGKMYDLQNLKSKDEQTQAAIKKHNEEINRLESERNALMEQREFAASKGDTEKVKELDNQLAGVNAKLISAIDAFIEFWKASNSPDAAAGIAQAEALKNKIGEVSKQALLTASEINEKWAGGISDGFSAFAEAIANGENALSAFRNSFLSFVSEFLIEIGKMIIKQTLLNMLQGGGGAGGGFGGWLMGGLKTITTGIFHSGKGPGSTSSGMSRSVSPALFANAPRFHNGKLPGLRAGEMAAIIEEDEEVLPTSDPRHAWNQGNEGSQAGGALDATIVNAFDAESFLSAGLASPNGRKLFMNFVRANKTSIKGALG